jgi:hypothetical protein
MPLMLFYALAVGGLGQRLIVAFEVLRAARFPLLQTAALLPQALTIILMALMVVIFCIRRLPTARAEGILPRLATVVASSFEFGILALPRAASSLARDGLSSALLARAPAAQFTWSASWAGVSVSCARRGDSGCGARTDLSVTRCTWRARSRRWALGSSSFNHGRR